MLWSFWFFLFRLSEISFWEIYNIMHSCLSGLLYLYLYNIFMYIEFMIYSKRCAFLDKFLGWCVCRKWKPSRSQQPAAALPAVLPAPPAVLPALPAVLPALPAVLPVAEAVLPVPQAAVLPVPQAVLLKLGAVLPVAQAAVLPVPPLALPVLPAPLQVPPRAVQVPAQALPLPPAVLPVPPAVLPVLPVVASAAASAQQRSGLSFRKECFGPSGWNHCFGWRRQGVESTGPCWWWLLSA